LPWPGSFVKIDPSQDLQAKGPGLDRLFWIDMEMTGLNVDREVVIEVAVLITDLDLNVVDSFETVVKQPQYYLDAMDAWNKSHHGQSGLVTKVASGMDPEKVEDRLVELVKKHFPPGKEKPMLAGNSIMQDRLFIDKYFPHFSAALHYRMLDVTSWKIMFQGKLGLKYQKRGAHRALDDIQDSIDELKFYMSHVQASRAKPT